MYKLDIEKAEEPEIKLPTSNGSQEKEENSRKTSTFVSLITLKLLTLWITKNCVKFLKRREYQITLLISCETCRQVKKQQLELDMEQWTGSKLGKEYIKAVYCHPAYLTTMQSTSWNAGLVYQEKYQQSQISRWHQSDGIKQRGTKEPLDECERGEWKSWLKTQHSKT